MYKVRLKFSKTGGAAYTSHLDLMKMLQRGFIRAGLPLRYSEGFNPHICMSILVPLSTGYESVCELCDIELTCDEMPENLVEKLNAAFPMGIRALEAIPAQRPPRDVAQCVYELTMPAGDTAAMEELFRSPVVLDKRSKRGIKEVDICPYIKEISFAEAGEKVLCRCVLAAGNDPLNPLYITRGLQKGGLLAEDAVVTYLRREILDEKGEIFF